MSDDDMRIAIAEALGGVWIAVSSRHDDRKYRMLTMAFNPDYYERATGQEAICNPVYMWDHGKIPDYLNDLNACAEMEKTLTHEQLCHHAALLASAFNGDIIDLSEDDVASVHANECRWSSYAIAKICKATARMRSIAFLKVKGIYNE